MPQPADVGGKRLISLAPQAWVYWLLNDPAAEFVDFLAGDFQWLSRATDVLFRVRHAGIGEFLVLNELQLHYDHEMPRRMRAYAALAEERYKLKVYPVVVNILPPKPITSIPVQYRSELFGLVAQQDYRVLNLWEIDANQVLNNQLLPLFPFVPVMNGGQDERILLSALTQLRANSTLAELETLLAFFATFVLELPLVQQLMRWDMTIVRQSPWYQEAFDEGHQKGIERGRVAAEELLLRVLTRRLGTAPDDVKQRLDRLSLSQLQALVDIAFDAASWAEFQNHVAKLQPA